jgi:hypothetical protein
MIDQSRPETETETETRPVLTEFEPVPRQCARRDGWTPDRQRRFIAALADLGSVRSAAHAVNMAPEGAYQLRRHADAGEFCAAWEAALARGVQRLEDVAMERALNGVEVPVYHFGAVVGVRRVYNDRLLMFLLRNRAPERFAAAGQGRQGSNRCRADKPGHCLCRTEISRHAMPRHLGAVPARRNNRAFRTDLARRRCARCSGAALQAGACCRARSNGHPGLSAMKVSVGIDEIEVEGDYGPCDGLRVGCSRCGFEAEVAGIEFNSARYAAVRLREECPNGENNFYDVDWWG